MVASFASSPIGWLPSPRTRLVGRDRERASARAFLLDDAVPLLTLTGPGGVGKTRLAFAVTVDVASRFSEGVVFVDFSPLADSALVASAIANALGVTPAAGQPIDEALITQMRPAQLLLLLDNCEHLAPEVATLVSTLLTNCPALQVLVTSRAALHVRGEQIVVLPPLPLPRTGSSFDMLCAAPAVALFAQRARSVDSDFALTEQNAEAVADVCRRLDGLPLAIELAAARSNVLSPEALLALLSQRLHVLSSGPHDAPARHRTIEDAIAWSYDLLSPEEQAFFRLLAVFAGSWTLDAAAAISGLPLPAALARLETLVDQSLVVRRSDANARTPRFALLETIREFSLERLQERGEEDAARDRHAAFFRDLIAGLHLYVSYPGDRSWFGTVAPEEDNLRQALDRFFTRGNSFALSELSSNLMVFWLTRRQLGEGRRWLELSIAHDQGLPASLRARCREAAGLFIGYHGDLAVAAPILDEAVALAREHGDPALLRHALYSSGTLALLQREFPRAMSLLEDAERAARAVDRQLVANSGLFVGATLCLQGVTARWSGAFETALMRFGAAEPFLRAPGGNWWLGMILGERGVIEVLSGSLNAAVSSLIESIARSWDIRNDVTLTRALRGLAAVAAGSSNPEAAAQLLGAATTIDSATPFAVVAAERDRDIVEWCDARLAEISDDVALDKFLRVGSNLPVEQSVALAREVAQSVLGAANVDEIWQATGAPDPGPAPTTDPTKLRLVTMPAASDAGALLTMREREVLELICQRLTDLEIAAELFISPRTANRHVSNILAKLDARNRREAAAIAVRLSIV